MSFSKRLEHGRSVKWRLTVIGFAFGGAFGKRQPGLQPNNEPKYKIYSVVHLRSVCRNCCLILFLLLKFCLSNPADAKPPVVRIPFVFLLTQFLFCIAVCSPFLIVSRCIAPHSLNERMTS